MSITRKTVLGVAIALFAAWFIANAHRFVGDDDGLIRFVLGSLFAILILLRNKTLSWSFTIPRWVVTAALVLGMMLSMIGIIFEINMVEWVGILLLLFACVAWVVSPAYAGDVLIAFLLVFCVHPLPGQLFTTLQHAMQHLSVRGAQMVLHATNVRIWADGLMLRTGYLNFLVPEICSGMRTAVTVLLCTFGVGMLLRLRWYEVLVFAVLGLAQVLILNITRIVHMVLWAPRMPIEWAETYLHDTVAVFLLGAIFLVQIEASWWKVWSTRHRRIRRGIETGGLERAEKASIVPGAIRRLYRVVLVLALAGGSILGVAGFIYKNRDYHKVEMMRPVIEALMVKNIPAAKRAIRTALALRPDDRDIEVMRVRAFLVQGELEEAVAALDDIESEHGEFTIHETILKGWALMRLGKKREAVDLVNTLPESAGQLPGVAMIRAEFASAEDQPDVASDNIVTASRSHLLVPRIRALFPYLASREQWLAISDSDHDLPYGDVHHALIAVRANLVVGNINGTARSLRQALTSWPEDSRFLHSLFSLAHRWTEGDWVDRYGQNLMANLMGFGADELAVYMNHCWQLGRVDLAWIVYARLATIDPDDPSLRLVPAQRGRQWFSARSHAVGVRSDDAQATTSLATFCRQTRRVAPFASFWDSVPLTDELVGAHMVASRDQNLRLCLEELNRRESSGDLTRRLEWLYPSALALSGRYDEAHKRLNAIGEAYPDMKGEVLLQHAVFYDQKQSWQDSYEALHAYHNGGHAENITARLMQVGALLNLNLGVAAMDVVDEARSVFPGASRLDLAEAAIWDVFGYKEQALFVLSKTTGGADSPIAIQLLHDTGRFRAAHELSEATGLGVITGGRNVRQSLVLPPAEWTIERRWAKLTDDDIRKLLPPLTTLRDEATSPYVRDLADATKDWLENRGEGASSDMDRWLRIGRSDREKVVAIYRLATLQARKGDFVAAEAAIRAALERMPKSPVLWRALLSVTEGDFEEVCRARKACPDDPDIWLAWLVSKSRAEKESGENAWAEEAIRDAAATKAFSAGALTRAGAFFYRARQMDLAVALARAARSDSRGLLPTCWLGVMSGVRVKEYNWALTCAIEGVENADDPTPFYKAIVEIKARGGTLDRDMLTALEYLQDTQKDDPRWAEALGRAYFQQGDVRRALTIFDSVVRDDVKNLRPQTLLLAAESARLDDKLALSIRILETAYQLYPDRVSVLNNLVYVLALDERTLPRARRLLPDLLALDSESFEVKDTIAMVYIRSGDKESAQRYMDEAMSGVANVGYSPNEMRLNSAEMQMRIGNLEAARNRLNSIREDASRSDFIDMKARNMLREITNMELNAGGVDR